MKLSYNNNIFVLNLDFLCLNTRAEFCFLPDVDTEFQHLRVTEGVSLIYTQLGEGDDTGEPNEN